MSTYKKLTPHCLECFGEITSKDKRVKFCSKSCGATHNNKKRKVTVYKSCKHCGTEFTTKRNVFCSKSCSAKYTNKNIKRNKKPKSVSPRSYEICGEYTRIYLCRCRISGVSWYSPTVKSIHPDAYTNRKQYAYQCRFTFSIRNFPEWFAYASEIIQQFGWYSATNRGGNIDGCSRDHMLSVSFGFENGIHADIISHPANCMIMQHRVNQSKHNKASITLDVLLERIDQFNSMYPNYKSAERIELP